MVSTANSDSTDARPLSPWLTVPTVQEVSDDGSTAS